MTSVAKTIRDLYDEGRIYDGTRIAENHIVEYGLAQSQEEVLLLARGLYAVGDYYKSFYWIKKTLADPINRIDLEDKLKRKLPCGNEEIDVG